ncbi:UNVERIFIED_CONTAM: hypothetical protein RMT77_005016 [Armadillidium vulgare]
MSPARGDDQAIRNQPTSIISIDKHIEPRTIKIVGIEDVQNQRTERELQEERESLVKLLTYLSRGSLAVASILFLCQAGAAICLCRPVAVLGGILVAVLFLCQGILGNYVVKLFSQILLVGFACLSGFVSFIGLGSALYLLSGQFTIACVSSFHTFTDHSLTRLRVVESISLIASVPCLMGAIGCFLAAALSAKASKRPKRNVPEPQLYLYLHPSPENNDPKPNDSQNKKKGFNSPSAPDSQDGRANTPPPSYNQVNESFA